MIQFLITLIKFINAQIVVIQLKIILNFVLNVVKHRNKKNIAIIAAVFVKRVRNFALNVEQN